MGDRRMGTSAGQINQSVMAVTSPKAVPAYGHRITTEWERVMTTNIDHELTETELDHVAGGKPSAAPKVSESLSLSYEQVKFEYTEQR